MASDYEAITEEYRRGWKENSEHAAEILASMYSQRTHFIFELLQNAEDVEATSIRFDLFPGQLEVRHDGRPFNAADVSGVCHIGEGTKANEASPQTDEL